jgi:hypothetical protein
MLGPPGDKTSVQVFELDPTNFRVQKHISAEKARWEPALHTWIFENGWSRQDPGGRHEQFKNFAGQATTFEEIYERPDYFLQEVLQDQQMNFEQLAAYIRDLKRSGIDTITLQVSFYRKFALPLFALVMALIAVPFAFLHRLLGDWPAVRAAGRREPVAGGDRGLVAGPFVRDGGDVLFHAHAYLGAPSSVPGPPRFGGWTRWYTCKEL